MPASESEPQFRERQEKIYNFIAAYIASRHIAPTMSEIMEATNISSTSVIHHHLRALEAAGKIGRYEGVARGIYLKDKA